MRKIKFLFCILLVFFFFKCGNVYAAQELTCIYKGDAGNQINDQAIMFVQDSNGEHYLYRNPKVNEPEINDVNWKLITANKKYKWETQYYNEDTGELSMCPSYAYLEKKATVSSYKFYLKDDTSIIQDDKEFHKQYDYTPDSDDHSQSFPGSSDEDKINNTNWLGICSYEDVTLYYNREEFILVNKEAWVGTVTSGFSLNQLLRHYDNACPPRLYRKDGSNSYSAYYYLTDDSGRNEQKLIEDESSFNSDSNDDEEEPVVIDDCTDLFSQEFINKINSYLMLVRVLVPILLIVMGILDFTKAVFSSSEDEMKKVQSKFMKRVLAAVLVFLIPTLANLLLEIANSIWNYIDPNSCNIG